jgi:cysteine desulfurase
MERIYLDYAASTPVHPEVKKAMLPYLDEKFGNAGSLHSFGREAMAALDAARKTVARILGAKFHEIIFTSSATEANNLVLRGIVEGYRVQGLGFGKNRGARNSTLDPSGYPLNPRIITTPIEHESIEETSRDLEKEDIEIVRLPVSREGFVNPEDVRAALTPSTVLVSVIYGSNIIGTIQPIKEIAQVIRGFKNSLNPKSHTPYPLFHTDAVQALQFLDVNVVKLGVDLMTLSGHKIYGPKGAGALYISENTLPFISPITTGGSQEFGLRAATENIPAIVGFGKAVELICINKESEAERIADLRNRFWGRLKKARPELELNGPELGSRRLPNNLHIYFPGYDLDELLVKFDMAGLAVSAGSACEMRVAKSSYVLKALGFDAKRASQSLRFSLGRPTTSNDIDSAVSRILKLL